METNKTQKEADVSITSERTVPVSKKNGKTDKKKKEKKEEKKTKKTDDDNKKKATTEAQTAIPREDDTSKQARRSKRKTTPADAAPPPQHTDPTTRTEASDVDEATIARASKDKDKRRQRRTNRIRAGGCGKNSAVIAGEDSQEASSPVNVDSGNCTLETGGTQRTQTESPHRFDAGESSRVALRDIMSKLFRLATPEAPSQSDCPSTTESASPSREITDAIEGMVDNYKNLVQWLEVFEKTDARDAVGFDLAMVICGCYDIAIRGLTGSVKKLFSECKNVKTLDDVPRADDIVECCAKFCADDMQTEDLANIVANRAPRYTELRSLADRLKPQPSHKYISAIRDGLCERFEALKETIVQLAVIVNDTNDELSQEKATRRQLEQEKENINHVLEAKEEEHTLLSEKSSNVSNVRIEELSRQLDEQKKIISKMSLCHKKAKRDWDDTKTQLVSELQKAKTSLTEKNKQLATVQEDNDQANGVYKHTIDILSHKIQELVEEKGALQRAHASKLENAHDEHSMAQQHITRLKEALDAATADLASKARRVAELERNIEIVTDDLEHNLSLVSEMRPHSVALGVLSRVLDVNLKDIDSNEIPGVINDKAVRSASWIEGLLRRACVARGDTHLDELPDSQATDDVFRVYESVLTAALRRLDVEQSPMEVADVTRRPKASKRKLFLVVQQGKRTCDLPEPEPALETKPVGYKFEMPASETEPVDYKFETPEPEPEPEKAPDEDLRVVVKLEKTARGQGFKLANPHKLYTEHTVAVSNRIADRVLRHYHGGGVVVDLGTDSPLSSLHQLLRPDDAESRVAPSEASCHCSAVESLAKVCTCALLICWSRSGSCELYGMEHSNKAMYVVIVDTDLAGPTKKHYYVLSGNVGDNEYTYNLVNLSADLMCILPEDGFFRHNTSGCRGPTGDLGDGVTHFAAVAMHDITLEVSE